MSRAIQISGAFGLILATYNLRSGGARRSHWSKILGDFMPEIFLVQETADPREHLPTAAHAQLANRVVWKRVEGRSWGSAVYSGRFEVRPLELPDFAGHVVGAEVLGRSWPGGGRGALRVFSIHAPHRSSYHRAVSAILDMIADNAGGGDIVIGGDFNISIGVRHGTEDRSTPKHCLAILRRLDENLGLLNCWQSANADQPLAQTLRWSNDRTIPYHCDGLFVPKSWASRLRACEVASSPDWEPLSDHNPVVAWFENGS